MGWSEDSIARLGSAAPFLALFEALPGICFFVREPDGRFSAANEAFLALLGLERQEEILGRTDWLMLGLEWVPAEEEIEGTGVGGARDEIRWVANLSSGEAGWHAGATARLGDAGGEPMGIAGVLWPVGGEWSELSGEHRAMFPVGRYMEEHYAARITLGELAALAELSERQFQRVFARVFGAGPAEHLLRVRIRAAARRLARTRESLAAIATGCGFYDQAHFTNQFRRFRGVTPLEFRKRRTADAG